GSGDPGGQSLDHSTISRILHLVPGGRGDLGIRPARPGTGYVTVPLVFEVDDLGRWLERVAGLEMELGRLCSQRHGMGGCHGDETQGPSSHAVATAPEECAGPQVEQALLRVPTVDTGSRENGPD